MIRLYKDGNCMGIETDCASECNFREEFSLALEKAIHERSFEGDWQFQLEHWLENYADICCRYRGMKDAATAVMTIHSGSTTRSENVFVEVDSAKEPRFCHQRTSPLQQLDPSAS
jgi:hypothetical protein